MPEPYLWQNRAAAPQDSIVLKHTLSLTLVVCCCCRAGRRSRHGLRLMRHSVKRKPCGSGKMKLLPEGVLLSAIVEKCYKVCYTCPSPGLPCVLRKVLRRSETRAQTGACAANIVMLSMLSILCSSPWTNSHQPNMRPRSIVHNFRIHLCSPGVSDR